VACKITCQRSTVNEIPTPLEAKQPNLEELAYLTRPDHGKLHKLAMIGDDMPRLLGVPTGQILGSQGFFALQISWERFHGSETATKIPNSSGCPESQFHF
jgi:hypothetical protein